MSLYARLQLINGTETVVEVIAPMLDEEGSEIPIGDRYHPDFVATLVNITDVTPTPSELWTAKEASGVWTFTAPDTPL